MKHIIRTLSILICLAFLSLGACKPSVDIPLEGNETISESETRTDQILDDPDQGKVVKKSGLTATLELTDRQATRENVFLKFVLENNTQTPLYILKWYTPLEGIAGEIFKVTYGGQKISYQGILASRATPTIDSYVFLNPGESAAETVDLAGSYDFSKAGEYTIEFLSPRISHTAHSEEEIASDFDQLGPVQILSNTVIVNIAN